MLLVFGLLVEKCSPVVTPPLSYLRTSYLRSLTQLRHQRSPALTPRLTEGAAATASARAITYSEVVDAPSKCVGNLWSYPHPLLIFERTVTCQTSA